MEGSSNSTPNLEYSGSPLEINSISSSPNGQMTNLTPVGNKDEDGKRALIITLGVLIVLIVVLACAILLINANNTSRDNDSNDETAMQNEESNNQNGKDDEIPYHDDIDCSHSEVDLKTLTGEDNPNVYNATTYLRTDSRYLCIEDWGVALSLPDNINAVIYTPVIDSTADYTSHRMSINAVIDENNNVNWGGNYMPDSYFSALAGLERAEPEKMDYIKRQYGITDSDDVFLKTDGYTYFVLKARGKDYVDYYKLLSDGYEADSFDIPEAFYDDILLIGDLVSNFNNYHVYDESKT